MYKLLGRFDCQGCMSGAVVVFVRERRRRRFARRCNAFFPLLLWEWTDQRLWTHLTDIDYKTVLGWYNKYLCVRRTCVDQFNQLLLVRLARMNLLLSHYSDRTWFYTYVTQLLFNKIVLFIIVYRLNNIFALIQLVNHWYYSQLFCNLNTNDPTVIFSYIKLNAHLSAFSDPILHISCHPCRITRAPTTQTAWE